MNPLKQQLKALVKIFEAAKINYVILGGIAVSIYGEPRLTADIDANIVLENAQLENFLKIAKRYNFYPIPKNIRAFVKNTGVVPLRFLKGKDIKGQCDLIIAKNIIEELALKRARIRKIDSLKIRVVSPEDLIIHKMTAYRPRDLEDIRGILMRRKGKLDIKYIEYWLGLIDKLAKQKGLLIKLFRDLL